MLDLDSTCSSSPLSSSASAWSNTWLASSRPCSRSSFQTIATRSRRCVVDFFLLRIKTWRVMALARLQNQDPVITVRVDAEPHKIYGEYLTLFTLCVRLVLSFCPESTGYQGFEWPVLCRSQLCSSSRSHHPGVALQGCKFHCCFYVEINVAESRHSRWCYNWIIFIHIRRPQRQKENAFALSDTLRSTIPFQGIGFLRCRKSITWLPMPT